MFKYPTADTAPSGADIIIIGAGSAGCLLANRLSADPARRVLLLEAGGQPSSPWLHVPIGYFRAINDARHTWQFATEPQAQSGDRPIVWPRGRVLGGSSAINGLVYIRGLRSDYDGWVAQGLMGWSFRDCLPYFKRHERYDGPPGSWHGRTGELGVRDLRNDDPLCAAWLAAAAEAGYPATDDFNGLNDHGIGRYQLTLDGHWRASAARAFLKPVAHRSNLNVLTGAQATRVLIERGRAVGVEWVRNGQREQARASAQVVLAAGAIKSPQLLMLSGIGPAPLLGRHGIGVVHDSPEVGRNLQDHYQGRVTVRLNRPLSMNNQVRSPLALARMGAQWLFGQRGPLTVGAGQVGGVVTTEASRDGRPDVQFLVMPLSVDKPGDPLHRFSGFSAAATQCRPASRGWLELASDDPLAPPRIVPNYLVEPHDATTLAAGLRALRGIYAQPAFRSLVADEYLPGTAVADETALIEFARQRGGTVFHPCGTCRMGADDAAPLDGRLRVRGIGALHVIDASALPAMPSANINAAVYMLAERGAAFITGQEIRA